MTDSLETTDAGAAFEEAFSKACSEVIALARKSKARLATRDPQVAHEFGRQSAVILSRSGATREEARKVVWRVLAAVLGEPQA